MALALDGSAHNGSASGTSVTVTLSTTTANDVIAVLVTANMDGTPSVSGVSSANTSGWTRRAIAHASGNTAFILELWYGKAAAALSSEVITVSFSSNASFATIDAFGVSGADTTTFWDGNTALPAQVNAASLASVTTSNANDFIISGYRFGSQPNPTEGTGFTKVTNSGADYQLAQYKIVSATQSALSCAIGTGDTDENAGVADAIVDPRAFGDLLGTLTLVGGSVGANNVLVGSVNVSIGDLIFVCFGQQTNLTASGATDSLGHTYTAQNAGTDSGTATGRAFWKVATTAGRLTSVTVAASSSTNDFAGLAVVIKGPFLVDASQPDKNPSNTDLTTPTSPFSCPATTTLSQADEVVMAWGIANQSTVWAATSPNLLAGNANSSTNIKVAIGYQKVAATTSVVPVFTAGANPSDAAVGTISFKKGSTDQGVTPSILTDSDTFPTQVVGAGPVDIAPSLLSDGDTLGTATFALVSPVTPALLTDGDTFPTQVVGAGPANVAPALFAPAVTFPTQTVGAGPVNLGPSLLADPDTLGTQTVGAGPANVAPALLTDSDTLGTQVVGAGPVDVAPALFAPASSFPTQVVGAGEVNVGPSLLGDADTLGAHTIAAASGAQDIGPSLFSDADTFFTQVVGAGSVDVSPSLFVETDTFFTSVVGAGPVGIGPSLFGDVDVFFDAAVVGEGALFPALLFDTDTFYSPAVSIPRTITPGLFSDPDSVPSHRVIGWPIGPVVPLSRPAYFFGSHVTGMAIAAPGSRRQSYFMGVRP